jgi:diguanylate cyclase (GGDEF)-like protein
MSGVGQAAGSKRKATPAPRPSRRFFAALDRGFRRLEPIDWVFGLFRMASVIIICAWVLWHPSLDMADKRILAILAAFFSVYSMLLSLGGILRPGSIRLLYHVAMVFDITFLGLVILTTGGIQSSLFYLGFYLLIPLLTYYFGARTGGIAYVLCALAYILPNLSELPTVHILDMLMKLGVLGAIYVSSGFLRMRQESSRNRLYMLNVEVEKKNRLLAHKQVSERNRIFELYALNKVGKMIAGALDTRELFNRILNSVVGELHFQHFCLWLYDEATNLLVAKAVEGIPQEVVDEVTVDGSGPIEGDCLRERRECLFEDLSRYMDYDYLQGYLPDIKSAMCVPIIVRGRIAGVISVYSKHKESFNKERLETFTALAEQISIALENSQIYNQMRFLSMQDGLTHVYNRRFFDEQMEFECKKADETDIPFALLLIDIDWFKKVNDELGHLAGDDVLKHIARVLMSNTRQSDFVCRYGGEEFGIILHNLETKSAKNRAERLRRAIENEVFTTNAEGSRRAITISIGISVFSPGMTPDSVVDIADQGLYMAKEAGRNCVKTAIFEF